MYIINLINYKCSLPINILFNLLRINLIYYPLKNLAYSLK
jgi:hypothetical protein